MGQRAKALSDHPDLSGMPENGHHHPDGSESGTEHQHDHHADHAAQFGRLFWVMTVIAIPVVAFSPMFASLLGYGIPGAGWTTWISPILGTVIYAWGGQPFLAGAFSEVKSRQPGMMLLIGLAITVAFISSWGATLGLLANDLDFWWEVALLVVIMLLGHWVEMRSLSQTRSALDSLAALMPDEAERVEGGETVTVAPDDLRLGDVIIVRPGAVVAADGKIVSGSAQMDESMVTGESKPVLRGEGDQVVAGTVATDSGVRVEVTAVGEQTTLAGIQKLVSEAQNSSSRAQRLADKASAWLFWFALAAAAISATVWILVSSVDVAVMRTITVLVIACPHALGLAIPLVVAIATERAAKSGVLIKDRLALEEMRRIDSVLFDKTGTLTSGEPTVLDTQPADSTSEDHLLALAAAAESDSEHPLARAIVEAARARGLDISPASGFDSQPAVGVTATVEGQRIRVGGPYLLEEENLSALPITTEWSRQGAIILHVVIDGRVAGALKLGDEVRPESRQTVIALHEAGIEVVMITGDAQAVADSVAAELGIDRVFAGIRPQDKANKVRELQDEGRRVAMVGDGVNDAPALAQADVGIAIGAGTDVAMASAGVILARSDPRAVLSVIKLSQATYRKMKQNLWWAGGYNILAVPLAAGVLAPIGFIMPMWAGAILMSLSTVVVAINAQFLRGLDLDPQESVSAEPAHLHDYQLDHA